MFAACLAGEVWQHVQRNVGLSVQNSMTESQHCCEVCFRLSVNGAAEVTYSASLQGRDDMTNDK